MIPHDVHRSYRSLEGRHGDPGSGTVHGSNSALEFMRERIRMIRAACPGIIIEVRKDSAFFRDQTVTELQGQAGEFTLSAPVERFAELQQMVQAGRRRRCFNGELSYFAAQGKPNGYGRA